MTDLPNRARSVDSGPAPAPILAVVRLVLADFRNYRRLELDAAPRPIVLTGPNGAGKTNILEALSLLSPGRGLRRATISDLERRRPAAEPAGRGWGIFARLAAPFGDYDIGTGRDPESPAGVERRIVHIDGNESKSQTALADLVQILWLAPDMDRILAGGGSERRQFLDRIVFNFVPDHARNVAAYEQTMRERNRLLAEGRADGAWLAALEQSMAESGVAVAAARRQVLDRLALAAASSIAGFPIPGLHLAGDTEAMLATSPALAAEEGLRRRLAASRAADAEAGRALLGPHRTDLVVTHRDLGMPAARCSTGQQKALLIALILAAARLLRLQRDAAPILLLDEVAAHLDADRRQSLMEELLALEAQVWLTGTDRALFNSLGGRATYYEISEGCAEPAPVVLPGKIA